MNPIVTIIIPIYNVELYLEKCIQSLLNQTYSNWRAILVDDESPDNCPQLCDRYALKDSRINVLHIKNGGLANARNVGLSFLYQKLAESDYEYVTFLDSDDYLASNCIEILINNMLKFDGQIINMSYCAIKEDGTILDNGSKNTQHCTVYTSSQYLHLMCYKLKTESSCTKLYRLDLIKNHFFEVGTLNEDFLFNAMLCFNSFKIIDIDYSGYYYVQRYGSISRSGANKAFFDSIRNPFKLILKAKQEHRFELVPDFTRFALFQIRCISFFLPYRIIWRENKDFKDLLTVLRKTIPNISQCTLPKGYKTTLYIINKFPRITCSILRSIYKLKKLL